MPLTPQDNQALAVKWIQEIKAQGLSVALANGAFDLLHVGHLRYLEAARAQADALIVAVNSDESVRIAKGHPRPLIPEAERLELVLGLKVVDYAFIFAEPTLDTVLHALRPDIHCKGTDYTIESVPERMTSLSLGIETRIVGDDKMHSTSQLLKSMAEKGIF